MAADQKQGPTWEPHTPISDWILGSRGDLVFQTWIKPLLGFIFAPFTIVMVLLVWRHPLGISGFDWVWIGLGVVMDVMKWGQIAANRRGIPGYPETAY